MLLRHAEMQDTDGELSLNSSFSYFPFLNIYFFPFPHYLSALMTKATENKMFTLLF